MNEGTFEGAFEVFPSLGAPFRIFSLSHGMWGMGVYLYK